MPKLAIPANSKFDARRAMELANLVQRAYEQFNSHQEGKVWEPETSNKLTGSTTCDADLNWPSYEGKVAFNLRTIFQVTERTLFVPETVPIGFIAQRKLEDGTPGIFIVFRGTLTTAEWFNNVQFQQTAFLNNHDLGLVSTGFQKIYTSSERGARSLEQVVAETLKTIPSEAQIFVTGHSLGAALATLATAHIAQIAIQEGFKKPILYTYASPRVGNEAFAAQFKRLEHYRIANSEDLVPSVPPSTGNLRGPEMRGQPIMHEGDTSTDSVAHSCKTTPSMRRNEHSIDKLAKTFRRNLVEQVYQHTGDPLYFTEQRGFLSTNHNMFDIYRYALPTGVPQSPAVELAR